MGWLPHTLAFVERCVRLRHPYGEKLESRARELRRRLDKPEDSLGFRIALVQACRALDLFDEEASLIPDALRFQSRMFLLGSRHPFARDFVDFWFGKAPLTRLMCAIPIQAGYEGADRVRIDFVQHPRRQVTVFYLKPDGWDEAMTIPDNLRLPMTGFSIRAERLGFEALRPYLREADRRKLPAATRFVTGDAGIEIFLA